MLFMHKKHQRGGKLLVLRFVLFVLFRLFMLFTFFVLFVLFVCVNLLVKKKIKRIKIDLIPSFTILLIFINIYI